MREHKINSQNNFIQGYYIDDDKISDDIINLFNNSNSKSAGMVGNGLVNKKVKDSTDLTIFPNEIKFYNVLLNYFEQLQKYLEYYKKKYSLGHMNIVIQKLINGLYKINLIFKNTNQHKVIIVGILKEVDYKQFKDI